MDKTAQRNMFTGRGPLNRIRELANVPAEKLSGFFKPEHERVMNALRVLDDGIRAEITGATVGKASPATGINQSVKELLKSARKSFARNEFMTGISELAAFHQKMFEVVKEINKFQIDVNKIHHKFLFEGTDDKKLQRMRSHMERKAELELASMMMKEAGVFDFFHNLISPRGRALAAWVKKYPKETKALREGGEKLVEAGQALYDNMIEILKAMGNARATRRPDEYMDQANRLKSEYAKFDSGDKGFTAYYNNVVKPFLATKDEMERLQKEETEKNKPEEMAPPPGGRTELGGQPPSSGNIPIPLVTQKGPGATVPTTPTPTVPELNLPAPKPPQQTSFQFNNPPGASPPFAPPVPTEIPPAPDTERSLPPMRAHRRFVESLEAMSGENPRVLAGYISKYAKSIQGTDPTTAISLFALARKIKG